MRVQPTDGSRERQLLIAAITSADFLCRALPAGTEPFRARSSNLVWGWCLDYYRKYKQAPGQNIAALYAAWAQSAQDKDATRTIDSFLASLSDEYTRQPDSLEFCLDVAEEFFNDVLLERLQEEVQAHRDRGLVKKALTAQQSFKPLNLHVPPAVNLLEDKQMQKQALLHKQQVLVEYPGPAGEFFGEELAEDSFVAFMAASKGAKSFTLLDVAWRALLQGRQVAYFQVGDLSQYQVIRRFHQRAAYRPLKAGPFRKPTSIILPPGLRELATVEYEDKVYEKDLSWPQARKAYEKICSKTGGRLHLSYHPIKTVSVADIHKILNDWDRDGWRAQVVVIDYAGNLAPVDRRETPVDQVSTTWALMRQISEMRRCLVVTAQQSNKEGFRAWVLTRNNFSESKMILAHVTAFLGVNRTDEEVQRGIIRYNFVVRREAAFSETFCLYAGAALGIANPVVVSTLPGA